MGERFLGCMMDDSIRINYERKKYPEYRDFARYSKVIMIYVFSLDPKTLLCFFSDFFILKKISEIIVVEFPLILSFYEIFLGYLFQSLITLAKDERGLDYGEL